MSLTVVVSARSNWRGHAAGHLVRRQAGVLPDHGDHRDADVRKDVDRRAQRRERTDDQDEEREHDEGVGPPQGDADQGDHSVEAPRVTRHRQRSGRRRARSLRIALVRRSK